jgi:hypothetical protein
MLAGYWVIAAILVLSEYVVYEHAADARRDPLSPQSEHRAAMVVQRVRRFYR